MTRQITRVVLIVSADAVIGAMLGMLVELAGELPKFPEHGEAPADAIRRVRAPLVCLDCNHDSACEDHAYTAAGQVRSEILLFAHEAGRERLERMARERDVHVLRLPIEPAVLLQRFEEVLAA